MACCVARARERTLLFLTSPALWPAWPFLPVVRRTRGREELGVVLDARTAQLTGYSATVFLTLCGAPHKVTYADWLIRQTLLDLLSRPLGFSSRSLGLLGLWTPHNQECSRRRTTCGRA